MPTPPPEECRYFVIYKPYGFLSQFTSDSDKHHLLGELHDFPKDAYSVGRLDLDSEGLLIITNDGSLNTKLLNPKHGHDREYWAQVERIPEESDLQKLRKGITLRINKEQFKTRPAKVEMMVPPPLVPERNPPVRFRKNVPDCWLRLTLVEGKYRQVRKMVAAINHPCIRLIRWRIEQLTLGEMQVGEVRELPRKLIYEKLNLREV